MWGSGRLPCGTGSIGSRRCPRLSDSRPTRLAPSGGPIIFGWVGTGHQIGAALTAYTAAWIRTNLGDYQFAFWGSGALCLLAAGLALQVGARPRRVRPETTPEAVGVI